MKKIIFVLALLSVRMVSCKKEYSCTCTTTTTGWMGTTNGTSTSVIKDTKKKAEETCREKSSTASTNGMSVTSTCSIQ
jgi:hypothetical protein